MTPEKQQEIIRRAKQDYAAMRSGWPIKPPYTKDEEYMFWYNHLQMLKKGVNI